MRHLPIAQAIAALVLTTSSMGCFVEKMIYEYSRRSSPDEPRQATTQPAIDPPADDKDFVLP